ncbi:MAG: bifunctional (p)ppGpp synthetase/guanosine-3',5'-bis(diphosphate) 3'-pyrophosphohydrolase [Candidatus Saganbacteria bacterium]|nr:bifunctional (p)ppGpp synthetase/guanosine-3',5'-bis(diphosphate) 3'-pyrophosphohydrolase [Candidatus Saganbacteria bacterium]
MKVNNALVRSLDIFRWSDSFKRIPQKRLCPPSTQETPFHGGEFKAHKNVFVKGVVHTEPFIKLGQDFVEEVKKGGLEGDITSKAAALSWEGHIGTLRADQKNLYIIHPLGVAKILNEWGVEELVIAAGLVHDLLEDGNLNGHKVTREILEERFMFLPQDKRKRLMTLIEGVTELGKEPDFEGDKPSLVAMYRKFLSYGSADPMIIVVKLADRLYNMRTLDNMPRAHQIEKAMETLNVYVPLADALGMWDVKRELEDLSFKYLEPVAYSQIKDKREGIIEQSEPELDLILLSLGDRLDQSGLKIEINKEKRHIYELHDRIRRRPDVSLDNLSARDVWRINIVIPNGASCFSMKERVLEFFGGEVDGESINRIYRTDPNGHRFIHFYVNSSTSIGRLLFQIRDQRMDRDYHVGIVSRGSGQNTPWLNGIAAVLRRSEELSRELFEGEIYDIVAEFAANITVATVNGPVELPQGGSLIECAGEVDPGLIPRLKGARINGRVFNDPFRRLFDGDKVEFVTVLGVPDPEGAPTLKWLEYARTLKALEALLPILKNRSPVVIREDAIRALDKGSRKHFFLPAKTLINSALFREFCESRNYRGADGMDVFLNDIGIGKVPGVEIIEQLRIFYQNILQKAETKRLVKYPVAIRVENRVGLLGDLSEDLGRVGLNIWDDYVIPDADRKYIILFFIIDVVSDSVIKHLRHLQIDHIAESHGQKIRIPFEQINEALERKKRRIKRLESESKQ